MSDETAQKVAALCQKLAEMELPCGGDPIGTCVAPLPDCGGGCGGTGKVARYPGVRVPCPNLIKGPWRGGPLVAEPGALDRDFHPSNCDLCNGRGWIASTDMKVWVAGISQTGRVLFYHRRRRGRIICKYEPYGGWSRHAEGETPLLALLAAIEQVPHD